MGGNSNGDDVIVCRWQRTQVLTYAASKMKEADRLFDYAMVVGLAMDEDRNHCIVHVLFHHPEQVNIAVSCGVLEKRKFDQLMFFCDAEL